MPCSGSLNVAEAKNRPVSKVITPLKDMLKQNVTVSEPCNLLHSSVRNPFPKHSDIALHCLEIGRKTPEFLVCDSCDVCDSCQLQSLRLLSFAKYANLVTCKVCDSSHLSKFANLVTSKVCGTLLKAHCQSMRKLQFAESLSESTI